MIVNKGSEWRKWDLHLHTPYTFINSYSCSDEEFIEKLLEEEISIIGLTNYFKFKDEEYSLMDKLRKKGIQVFLNLEVRLDYQNKEDDCLDLHIIFSDDITKTDIDKLVHNVKANVQGTDKKLIDLETSDDFKFAVVNFDNLQEQLNDDSLNLKGKYLLGFLSRGKGNGRTSSSYEKLAQKTDILIHSSDNENNIEQDRIFWLTYNKTVIQSSDAHSLDTIGNKYTWIKANPTFEGLKQVIYEPKHRVAIQKNKPNEALHKLEKIELSFDKNLKWDNDKFCFAGFNKAITLSPHLTCIIGGRGSGKSTLLNLIAQKIGKEETDFFKDLKVNTSDYIKFEPEFVENIEFLAQNTIESFATDSKKFTQAIFERIDKSANGELVTIEDDISNELKIYDEQIFMLKNRDNIDKKLKEQSENLVKYKNIIKTFKDKEYTDNKKMLQGVQKKIIEIESSRERYKELFIKIKEIYSLEKVTEKNKYDKYFNDLLSNLNTLYEKYKKYDYTEIKKELEQYKKDKNEYIHKIEKYLNAKGLSEENVKDAQQASLNIEKIENEIKKLNQDKKLIKDKLKSFSFIGLDSKINNFKTTIEEELKKINLKFENISKENNLDVKAIKVEYKLNEDIFDNIFEELTQILEINPKISLFRKAFKDYLQNDIDINDVLNISESSEFINKITDRKTQAYQVLLEIFNIKTNFDIYKLIIQKHKRDIKNNKLLKVYYDNKTLNNSSFGQKCTTAIVILLSLGNTPIIIDEPEAHLDSSLIANYLVELIKEQKQHRQIIFATHNANFVLNADAELVVKLQNDSGVTSINSFPIEDLVYRKDLLRLEGGAEAFKKREKKYNISSFK